MKKLVNIILFTIIFLLLFSLVGYCKDFGSMDKWAPIGYVHNDDDRMPSVGDVKVLVVPIEFKDVTFAHVADSIYGDIPITREKAFEMIQTAYLSEQDITDPSLQYSEMSMKDYFKKTSYNKLRLSGVVLPIYSVAENKAFYQGSDDRITSWCEVIAEAIRQNKELIGDLSEYDKDNDGYIDCLHVVVAGDGRNGTNAIAATARGVEIYDGIRAKSYAYIAFRNFIPEIEKSLARTPAHETGHLLKLPDNYQGKSILPYGCADLMSTGIYMNVLYKYLLGWENVEVLPYEDMLQEIDLYASDVYNDEVIDKTHGVIFIPDPDELPISEFYMVEYRVTHDGRYAEECNPGVMIWHVNLKGSLRYGVHSSTNNLQLVYKSNETDEYRGEDVYRTGDCWTSTTTPSSDFYDDVYTGAYLKVLNMDGEKARLLVGYQNPDIVSKPRLTISPPSRKAVRSGESVEYTVTYENADGISWFGDPQWSTNGHYFEDIEGDVTRTWMSYSPQNDKLSLTFGSGEGAYGFSLTPRGAYRNGTLGGRAYAQGAVAEKVYVDNTPPQIIPNGGSEIILECGIKYVELGAKVTDNLDVNVGKTLSIDATEVDTNHEGTYLVHYSAVDHAGNIAKAERTVRVVAQSEVPFSVYIGYSTQQLTNQDVVVTLLPSKQVTEDAELTHVFTENGEYTFHITDLLGNTIEKTVKVDWIDKIPLNAEVKYSTQEITNRDVTVTIIPSKQIVAPPNLSYTFEENGTYTFVLSDLAGNMTEVPVMVDWIDKTPPTAEVQYSTQTLTNEDVTATITFSEPVTITSGELTATDNPLVYTVVLTENVSLNFDFVDVAGNKGTQTVEVDWIDKIPPTAKKIVTSPAKKPAQKGSIMVVSSEPIKEGSVQNQLVKENGIYTFTLTDLAGNVTEIEIVVDWIDKTPPTAQITYSPDTSTSGEVTATIRFSEPVTITDNSERLTPTDDPLVYTATFKNNSTLTISFSDIAGNYNTATMVVNWIDKDALVKAIEYSTIQRTNEDVVATITFAEPVTIMQNMDHLKQDADNELVYRATFMDNGSLLLTFENAEGKMGSVTLTVDWIDKTPPTAQVAYSTERPTRDDVTVTLTPSEDVEETELTHTFTENGEYVFTLTDKAGNIGTVVTAVDWIDRTPPTAQVAYSTESLTNGNVTVALIPSEDVEETELTHTFTENGEYVFTLTDKAGNVNTVTTAVTWIDKTPPTATVAYSTEKPTGGNVVVTLTPSKEIEETELTHTFTENGEYVFTLTDKAGNVSTVTTAVTWIDRTLPTANVKYIPEGPTRDNVTATLVDISKEVEITGELTHVFEENGTYEFELKDLAGNIGVVAATVDWIDKTPPTAEVQYSTQTLTNEDVTATITFSEPVTITSGELTATDNPLVYTAVFTENNSLTFEFADAVGNTGIHTAEVDWIDKIPPTACVEYSTTELTSGSVTATLVDVSEEIVETELTHTFTENGAYDFVITDKAGNTATISAEVTWIVSSAIELLQDGMECVVVLYRELLPQAGQLIVAEYTPEGVLVGIKLEPYVPERETEDSIYYTKQDIDNSVRVFLWDSLRDMRSLI